MISIFVDVLSKKPLTIPCQKSVTKKDLTEICFLYCFRYLGLLEFVVRDRVPQFISKFWGSMYAVLDIERKLFAIFHPEKNGQMNELKL